MKMPEEALKPDRVLDRRNRHRSKDLIDPMAVITSFGSPLYQLKVQDLSDQGVGIVVRSDSHFLKVIEVGKEVDVRLVLPRYYRYRGSADHCRSRVEHITEIQEGPFKGHLHVGISFGPLGN